MKYAKGILALGLTLVSTLAAAQLSNSETIVVQVPFQFTVANKIVPAGQWVVHSADTTDRRTVVIRNTAAKLSLFSEISPDETKEAAGAYALVFHRYGDQYFLTGIKRAGDRNIYRLRESKAEAELRAGKVPMSEKVMEASTK